MARRTRRKEYLQYLAKWKGHPIEDSSWLDAGRFKALDTLLKSSWTGAMSLIYPGNLMQEHQTKKATVGNGFLLSSRKEGKNYEFCSI